MSDYPIGLLEEMEQLLKREDRARRRAQSRKRR